MQTTFPLQIAATGNVQDLSRTWTGKVSLAVGATAFVALCAHISFPLYFTPVPVTLQTLAVILVGLVLGPSLGAAAMVLYLAEGAMGLPVFSPHGLGGVAQLLGPTAGYLFSYPLAAAAAGAVVRAVRLGESKFPAAALAGISASVFIFAMGAGWLAYLFHLNFVAASRLSVVPFLPGEVLKVVAAATVYATRFRGHRF